MVCFSLFCPEPAEQNSFCESILFSSFFSILRAVILSSLSSPRSTFYIRTTENSTQGTSPISFLSKNHWYCIKIIFKCVFVMYLICQRKSNYGVVKINMESYFKPTDKYFTSWHHVSFTVPRLSESLVTEATYMVSNEWRFTLWSYPLYTSIQKGIFCIYCFHCWMWIMNDKASESTQLS